MTATSPQCLCQECKKVPSLYQCPRCARKTCSLECCKTHKLRLKCSGKRNRTAYARLEHMSTCTLQSDFHFLEDVLQEVDGGKRLLKQIGVRGPNQNGTTTNPLIVVDNDQDDEKVVSSGNKRPRHHATQPPKWRKLVQQAESRNTTLLLMPPGMERHKNNTSYMNQKSGLIFWKLEFILHSDDSKPTIKVINKVSEEANLREEWDKLKEDDGTLHFLLKKLPSPSNRPTYTEIRRLEEASLKEILTDGTVIEYPTIHVVPSDQLHKFPRLIQEEEVEADEEEAGNDDTSETPVEEDAAMES